MAKEKAHWLRIGGGSVALVSLLAMLVFGYQIAYANKIYPGIEAHGAYLGGLSRGQALDTLAKQQAEFERQLIPVRYGDGIMRISPDKIDLDYHQEAVVDQALQFGRRGNLLSRLHQQLRSLFGKRTQLSDFTFNSAKLSPYVNQIDQEVTTPVVNASLQFEGEKVIVSQAQAGQRLDGGRLVGILRQRMAQASSQDVTAPIYEIPPAVGTAELEKTRSQAERYLQGPVTITQEGAPNTVVTINDIIGWIEVTRQLPRRFEDTGAITDFVARPTRVTIALNEDKIKAYVAKLAAKVDRPGQDAALAIADGKATVFKPSRDGFTLNQDQALSDIKQALTESADRRELALQITVTKPKVREESLNDLGINELISEGISFFPGSTKERMQNVRTGAARYNGVLLAPDQVFSFGEILGDVGPETGYAPARVIIGNRQETQYGGGLCQVSSTAYRAALNAGLPILQRTNHSFAVSYYTAPYGVPGVDATIYYPQVDLKFKNDTGHYILIQTIMEGTTLKFDFYGTKTKTGRIRGPFFVSGSADATQPSQTVFYRDVLDLAGNVTKTDSVTTSYKSSDDFPVQQEFR